MVLGREDILVSFKIHEKFEIRSFPDGCLVTIKEFKSFMEQECPSVKKANPLSFDSYISGGRQRGAIQLQTSLVYSC